jgi:hypothetical protein
MNRFIHITFQSAAFLSLLLLFSCSSTKRAQKIPNKLKSGDAGKVVQVRPGMQSEELDSLHRVLEGLDSQKIRQFTTLKAKVKLDYSTADNSAGASASIRLQKDSIIWISLTGPFAIEGYRMLIRPDSLILMDKLKHTVTRRPISYLEEIAKMPITFQDMQNIILGNPLFTKGDLQAYRHNHNRWYAVLEGDVFKSFLSVVASPHKLILKSNKIEQEVDGTSRSCALGYSNYQTIDSVEVAMDRKIKLEDKKSTDIKLQFKEVIFNQPLSFPFSIPKNYEQR